MSGVAMIILGEMDELEREINRAERERNFTFIQLVGPLPLTGTYFGLFRRNP